MQDHQLKVIAMLRKYMRDPAEHVGLSTTFSKLEIDALDLPMIFLDIEDGLDVYMTYDDEQDRLQTVGDLITRVELRLTEKRLQAEKPKVVVRQKRGWMSTATERRR